MLQSICSGTVLFRCGAIKEKRLNFTSMSHGPASLVVDPVPIRLAPALAVPVISVPTINGNLIIR